MNEQKSLIKYAIIYLSKYSSSKKNLERILKNKIRRLKIEKKDKFLLYNSIIKIIEDLEKNKLINDETFVSSKIRLFINQGKSKNFIKSYFIKQGIPKNIYNNIFNEFNNDDPNWELESAKNFVRKKRILDLPENRQKNLNKMIRAGFNYDMCKKILETN